MEEIKYMTAKEIKKEIKKNGYCDVYSLQYDKTVMQVIRFTKYRKKTKSFVGMILWSNCNHKTFKYSKMWGNLTNTWIKFDINRLTLPVLDDKLASKH